MSNVNDHQIPHHHDDDPPMSSILFRIPLDFLDLDMRQASCQLLACAMHDLQDFVFATVGGVICGGAGTVYSLAQQPEANPGRVPDAVAYRHLRRHLLDLQTRFHAESSTITFSFQPDNTFSNIRKAVVHCIVGKDRMYEINLCSEMIQDVADPSEQWDISSFGSEATEVLRTYAERTLRRVKRYRDKLGHLGLIDDSPRLRLVSLFSCPICSRPLQRCTGCSVPQACSNSHQCAAAPIHDMESCSLHRYQHYCRECIDNAEEGYAPLAQCPTCHHWFCREDLDWCFGNVEPVMHDSPSSHLQELMRVQEYGWDSAPRSHPPIPGPCSVCLAGGVSAWPACANANDAGCPYWGEYFDGGQARSQLCPDCVPDDPLTCHCGQTQFCGICIKTGYTSQVATCPRCRDKYCLQHCNYIDQCVRCKAPRLCQDCVEEEDLGESEADGDGDGDQDQEGERGEEEGMENHKRTSTHSAGQCKVCAAFVCKACAADAARCSACHGYICDTCVLVQKGSQYRRYNPSGILACESESCQHAIQGMAMDE
ncbi:hypothetical protein F5I97DRAFT_12788 [Phlebopus sp. FC_14]|nr:hypothetical protein F5I97DRAFT_12788 [Phlebopus sp. FC_14]